MKRSELRRNKPLARTSGGLSRSKGLTKGNGRTAPPERQTGLQRSARKRKARIPPATKLIVEARSRGRCIVCGHSRREAFVAGWSMDRHHVFDEALFPELAVIAENLVLICGYDHGRHTSALARIPLSKLPQCALDLADGDGPRTNFLARTYA